MDPQAAPAIKTKKLTADNSRSLLAQKLEERVAEQPALMDALARQLLTLELAVPGLYAAVLKLLSSSGGGVDGGLAASAALYLAFGCWLLAIVCTLVALFPKRYRGDPNIVRGDGSPEYAFNRAAKYKYRWLLAACCAFVLGLGAAIYDGLAATPQAASTSASQAENNKGDVNDG